MTDQRQPSRKVPYPVTTGNWAPPAHGTDTASPLERNPRSPKGWKKREFDGVGLGIVAALEKSDRPSKIIVGALEKSDRPSKIIVGAQKAAPIAIVPPRKEKPSAATGDFPVADFLSSCYLCRKRLHGKDIFMYRGEKAFCSMECRYQQIMSDECVEKFETGALRPSKISNSPCYIGGCQSHLFFTGIMAA